MGTPVLTVENVSVKYRLTEQKVDDLKDYLIKMFKRELRYKEFLALQNVSFSLEKGDRLAILGMNGAGKSTLLKVIAGVLKASEGTVKKRGMVVPLLELGAGFNMEYTGLENIYFNGTLLGYTKEQMEERVPKIVEFAGIGDYIHQPVKTYSSGMFARLAFAMAINVEPDILIVDEALSVGDIYFQSLSFYRNLIRFV